MTLDELRVMSPSSVEVMFERVAYLSQGWENVTIMVDMSQSKRPDSRSRATLNASLAGSQPPIEEIVAIVGGNRLIKAVARFVLAKRGIKLKLVKTREEGLNYLRQGHPGLPN